MKTITIKICICVSIICLLYAVWAFAITNSAADIDYGSAKIYSPAADNPLKLFLNEVWELLNATAGTTTANKALIVGSSKQLNELTTTRLLAPTMNYAADVNGTDAYKVTLNPAPTAYTKGMMVIFDANTANVGACTLNVNSLGAKALKALHDQDPPNDYIEAHSMVMCVYDGTNFQIINPDANS
jgi:hypothetical protein